MESLVDQLVTGFVTCKYATCACVCCSVMLVWLYKAMYSGCEIEQEKRQRCVAESSVCSTSTLVREISDVWVRKGRKLTAVSGWSLALPVGTCLT